jgi:hypothetical protein
MQVPIHHSSRQDEVTGPGISLRLSCRCGYNPVKYIPQILLQVQLLSHSSSANDLLVCGHRRFSFYLLLPAQFFHAMYFYML